MNGRVYVADALRRVAGRGTPDEELLARFAADRDEAAFGELVRRHGPAVYRECLRGAGSDAADDAFQATFLILARRAGRLDRPDRLAGWLFGVASRVARRARRQLARRRSRERPVAELPDAAAPAAGSADWQAVVHEELSRLPADYRAAVVLCDLEGHPRREAARLLGVPDGTLSNRLARARAMLGRRLLRRGVGPGRLAVAAVVGALPSGLMAATAELATGGTVPVRVRVLAATGGLRMTLIRAGVLTAVGLAAVLTLAPATGPLPAPAGVAAATPDPTPVDGLWVRDMALSPDGKLLAMTEWTPKGVFTPAAITFFDPTTFKQVRRLTAPDAVVGRVAFAPDGKTAYVNAAHITGPKDATVNRVDVATWKVLGRLDPDAGYPSTFALSPDGKTAAVHLEQPRPDIKNVTKKPLEVPVKVTKRIALYDAVTFAHLRDLTADVSLGRAFAFAPDGKAIGVAYTTTDAGKSVGGIVEFDPETGKELRRCSYKPQNETGSPRINRLVYAPDGKRAVIVGGTGIPTAANAYRMVGAAHYWDRKGPRVDITWVEGENGYFTTGLFSPAGRRFYLGSCGPTQRTGPVAGSQAFWHASKGQCWDTTGTGWWFNHIHWSADGEQGDVSAMVLDPTGTRLLLADAAGVWVFDAATGQRRGGLIATRRD